MADLGGYIVSGNGGYSQQSPSYSASADGRCLVGRKMLIHLRVSQKNEVDIYFVSDRFGLSCPGV